MKRLLSLVCIIGMILSVNIPVYAEEVEEALKSASKMTDEELYAKAKEEMDAGAQLNFYSTTSFAEKAAANFEEAYPDLAGKLIYAEVDDGETYTKLIRQIHSGKEDAPDMALVQNGPDLEINLLEEGLSYNYFPAAMEDIVPKQYQDPAVVTFINSLMIYNNTGGALDVSNIWQLTEPEWKGRIFFKNPMEETVNLNFLILLTTPEWTKKVETAYKNYYGEKWKSDEFESASFQWIDGFLKNADFSYDSGSSIATGVADGQAGDMGIFVFSKLRKLDEAEHVNMSVLPFESEVDCFSGFMYNVYATVCRDTECPYTCALFINWLLSEEGFAGPGSWNSNQGYYSPNTLIDKPEDLEDEPYVFWEDKLVFEDLNYIESLDNYDRIYRFINACVGK